MKINNAYPHLWNRLIKPVEKITKSQIHNQGRYQQSKNQIKDNTKGAKIDVSI